MPCYSTVQTKLTDLAAVKKAAEELGLTVKEWPGRLHVADKSGAGVTFTLPKGAKYISAQGDTYDLLPKITERYAVGKVKQFAQKRGYMVSRGTKPGEFVLTSYR